MSDFRLFNVLPSGGYSAGSFAQGLYAQHAQNVKIELLVNWLLECLSEVYVAPVPFTLLNITSHSLDYMAGNIEVPAEAVYGDSAISFTFALSNAYLYLEPKIRFSNGPVRTWSETNESRVEFATVTLTRNKAQEFGLKIHTRLTINNLWLWVGSSTKNHFRHPNRGLLNADIRVQHSAYYNLPTINMVNSFPREVWSCNKHFWNTPVINTLTDHEIWYALCYHTLPPDDPTITKEICSFIQRGLLTFAQKINGVIGEEELPDLVAPNLLLALMNDSRIKAQSMTDLLDGSDEASARFDQGVIPVITNQKTPLRILQNDSELGDTLWESYDL